jgi:hypothetical protein
MFSAGRTVDHEVDGEAAGVVGRAGAPGDAVHGRPAEGASELLGRRAHVGLDGAEAAQADAAVHRSARRLGSGALRRGLGLGGGLLGGPCHLLLRQLRGLHEPGGVGDLRLRVDRLDGRLEDLGDRVVVRARLHDGHDGRVGADLRTFWCCAADQRESAAGNCDGGGTPPQRGRYGPERARTRSSAAGDHRERVLVRASAPGGAMPSHDLPSGSTAR